MNSTQAELFARSFQSQVARNPGAALLTLPLLRELGVVTAVNEQCPSDHTVSHGHIAQLLVCNRLQAPRPLYKVGAWLEHTALSAALQVAPAQAHDTRLGETLDALFPKHQAVWQTVIQQALQQYHLPLAWLHYDITSTYFEGLYTESEMVKFGYSRDQRSDSKQLNLGVNVTGDGLPLAFRVLVGNTADVTTPRENLTAVRTLLPKGQETDTTVVHDRGMATIETLLWYEQQHQFFISPITADAALQAVLDAVPAAELRAAPLDYLPQRAPAQTAPRYAGVWREHTLTQPDQTLRVRVLVVYSQTKAKLDAEKRQAQLDKLCHRLTAIQGHLNQRKYKRRAYVEAQIHLAQRGNAAKTLVDVALQGEEGALILTFQVNATRLAQQQARDGRYPLVTNRWDLSALEVLQHFKQQDLAEKRFAIVKGPLQIHPLWLHKDERLVSLVLIVMLALLVYCLLEHLVRQAQRHLTGRALLELFGSYMVVLLQFADGSCLWTYPALTSMQTDVLERLRFPTPQMTLMLS
ncbi:IS1634 family transposase [Anaerolineae bacterium CFX7]|nr:IS1634 family transposase [Anaerolineae bacterium CFX7]